MSQVEIDPKLRYKLTGKTTLITGAAGGIGAAIVQLFAKHGANVVLTDLEHNRKAAEALIELLGGTSRAAFIPANTLIWAEMKNLFKEVIQRFGRLDIVIANAGLMESNPTLDMSLTDDHGDLVEATDASKVIDVNIKGTLNTLRLGLFHLKDNPIEDNLMARGSIVLVSSTSGYFGASGVAAYVSSKHGVTGLLRASQVWAEKYGVRINGVAPFVTPTNMAAFHEIWASKGLPSNTPEGVAAVIAQMALDPTRKGQCCLTCGSILVELEASRNALHTSWVGKEASELMATAGKTFRDIGGYPLPQLSALSRI
ncbi:uncharacterized protein A1O9_11569 [Exophiala aquamarina CBS 119918]|uniref:Ketoreductase domain-containing protein n=1 Tax=Exophiala aquamarina CBS 119918 TaxID=1182545 RepID=A0A072NWV7_9EURO|nr:uncharacterized protein A1O9_11569 [Exophiala aquamarina CBS 119918]KEF52329.1 hypothetical protein A1O9_11569 [Exophiala aquamarina CBS 119918]